MLRNFSENKGGTDPIKLKGVRRWIIDASISNKRHHKFKTKV